MSSQTININIDEILGDKKPEKIDIAKLETGTVQARQLKTEITEDDELVDQIRKVGGLLQPIIVKQKDNDRFEIILGQRRWGAYKILVKDDPEKYSRIKAYVIEKDLSEDDKKVISFIENASQKKMEKRDYVDVIEYFYMKYGRKISQAAEALGIKAEHAKKYLTEARLGDKVRKCINEKQFSIDMGIKALEALGDDEESVDDDVLIETAIELKRLAPARRKKTIEKMKQQPSNNKDVKSAIKQAPTNFMDVKIEVTDEEIDKLERFKDKHRISTTNEAASEAMTIGLDHDLQDD